MFKVVQMVDVSKERVQDLLTCAFEGGSNYWYTIKDYRLPAKPEEIDNEYRRLEYPMHPGGAVIIEDSEGNDHILHLPGIRNGLQLMANNYPDFFGMFIGGHEDAAAGDIFLQLCLFQAVIYG